MSKLKNIITIIFFCIIIMSKEDTISNPTLYEAGDLPGVFFLDNYFYVFMRGKYLTINKLSKQYTPIDYSVTYNEPYLWMLKENNVYLCTGNYIFSVNYADQGALNQLTNIPDIRFRGYIKETKFSKETKVKYCECDISKNEIILYGISIGDETSIIFFFKNLQETLTITDESFSGINENISCNKVSSGQYLCAIEKDNAIKIILIRHYWISDNNCSGDIYKKFELDNKFTLHSKPKIYDAFIPEKK